MNSAIYIIQCFKLNLLEENILRNLILMLRVCLHKIYQNKKKYLSAAFAKYPLIKKTPLIYFYVCELIAQNMLIKIAHHIRSPNELT